jgi:hypothetical protein
MANEPNRTDAPTAEPKKDESGPVLSDRAKTRAERFRAAQAEILERHALTFKRLAE